MFSVQKYLNLSDTPADEQTRWAAFFLDGPAKIWYFNIYEGKSSSSLKEFLAVFKKYHLKSNHKDDAANRIEHGERGSRTIAEYSTEIKLFKAELEESAHPDWIKRHYLHDFNNIIRKNIASEICKFKDLDEIIEIS